VLIGCLFHPYFSLYWAAIFASTYLGRIISKEDKFSFERFTLNINLPLLFFGSITYFTMGYFTWLVGPPSLELDPFQFMGKNILLNVINSNFEFLLKNNILIIALVVLLLSGYTLYRNGIFIFRQPNYIIISIFIITSSIAIPLFLSYISYQAGYWILTRQWIGSFFLAPLGLVMLVSQFFKKNFDIGIIRIVKSTVPVALFFVIFPILIHRFYIAPDVAINHFIGGIEINTLIDELPKKEINWVHMADKHYSSLERKKIQAIADKYVLYANKNIALGGPVNKAFTNFYCTVHSVRRSLKLSDNCFKSEDSNFR
jgi:hypothetical protein